MKNKLILGAVALFVGLVLWWLLGPSITGIMSNSYSQSTRDVYIYKISHDKGTVFKVSELEALPIHAMIVVDKEGNITSGSFKASIDDQELFEALLKVRGDELVRLHCNHRYFEGTDSAEHLVESFELLDNSLPRDRDKKSIGFIPVKEKKKE